MNKIIIITSISLLLSNNIFAKQKYVFDEEFLELKINTSDKKQSILNKEDILLINNNSSKLNNYLISAIIEMKPINSYIKFGFDFNYENTEFNSETISNSSITELSIYSLNLYSKIAIIKSHYFDLYSKLGFGYSSYTFTEIDNRAKGYDSGIQSFNLNIGIGANFSFKNFSILPIIEYNINPFNDVITLTNNTNNIEYNINKRTGMKITLPIYFKTSKYEQFGTQFIYSDNTFNFDSFSPNNDIESILSYNKLYTKNKYIGIVYKIKF